MNILITGATGFIGRHVMRHLSMTKVDSITILTRNPEKILHEIQGANVKIIEFDLADDPKKIFNEKNRYDALIHLAWDNLPNFNKFIHIEKNLPIQISFLYSAVSSGIRNLIVTGTCQEYGIQNGKLAEDTLTNPSTAYSIAKDTLRRTLENLQLSHEFNLSWARLFYLNGKGQSKTSLFSQLRLAIESNEDCFNLSSGEQIRDYLEVDTAAKYIVRMLDESSPKGIINVCSGNPVSIRKLVEDYCLSNSTNIKLNFGIYSIPPYEPLAFWGCTNKLSTININN